VCVDGDATAAAPTADIGNGGVVTISFDGTQVLEGTEDGISTWYLESAELFGGVTWPHAGVYEYEIEETGSTFTPGAPPPTETMTLSKAVYTVKVYVDECNDANCTDHNVGDLYITHIGVLMVVDDGGEEIDAEDQEKVDPTPGGGTGSSFDYSQMAFTNEYWKTMGPVDPEDGDYTLAVSKEVAGTQSSTTMYFPFTLTLDVPDLQGVPAAYTAYVVEEDTANPGSFVIVTAPGNYSGTIGTDGSIVVDPESVLSFGLKHGQKLVIIDLPVGTAYTASEAGTAGYTPKVEVCYDGGTPVLDDTSGVSGSGYDLPNNVIGESLLFVGEGDSYADFLNDRGNITPTGLIIANLPFIGMIALAIGAVALFIAAKSRRRSCNN
jgi:hypothetical protein